MKINSVVFVFVMWTLTSLGQSQSGNVDAQIGTIYKIGKAKSNTYKYINFPKPNMIIKRGGIANYNRIKGSLVVVTAIQNKKDGSIVITIKREDDGRFFGSHSVVTANFKAALESGELLIK